jgi:hypothetical protein
MKTNHIYLTILLAILGSSTHAQPINWASLTAEQKHIINAQIGAEHGLVYELGYGHQLRLAGMTTILSAEYSAPSGSQLIDDFKAKTGVQVQMIEHRSFHLSAKVQGVFRRYQNGLSRMLNFGSDMSITGGYYRKQWFAAGEGGFDKAIVSHFKHSAAYKANYEGATNGWYEPSMGGNFYFGLGAGYAINKYDIYLKGGRMLGQDLKSRPTLPYYAYLGCNIRL